MPENARAGLTPEERAEMRKGPCSRCSGRGTIEQHDGGVHYETDTPAEHALHRRTVDCPQCGNFRKRALDTIDALEAERDALREKADAFDMLVNLDSDSGVTPFLASCALEAVQRLKWVPK